MACPPYDDWVTITLPTIAVLGAGSMGSAIVRGLLAHGVDVSGGIRVTNRTENKAKELRVDGVTSTAIETDPEANVAAVAEARLVLIAVKPALVEGVLREIASALAPGTVVISLAAGVTIGFMEQLLPETTSVMRAMPNTPANVGLGVTGLVAGSNASHDDVELAKVLFGAVGQVLVVAEDKINALSAISGSGPAYVYYLIEELVSTAAGLGFSAAEAEMLVTGTFRGAAELLEHSGKSPQQLRQEVTSPRGTTERAIEVLKESNLKGVFDRAVAAAVSRADQLAAGA
ncbi:MAG: proC [Homoserinimonas sp.]|jgi:pyrroline-5-carboxylate reductase|nr:proC [Homoserinimonas sp.]